MSSIQEYIESGIVEMYVFGALTPAESADVELMAKHHPEVQAEIEAVQTALDDYALAFPVEPDSTVKPLMMAGIDYQERLAAGETPAVLPLLNEHSRIEDYREWLDRPDMTLPDDAGDLYAKIISATPQALSLLAWIKVMAPQEVHDHESERFLIVEGSCYITVEDTPYALSAGDYFAIPLHKSHTVTVTSSVPCKVVLQRVPV